MVEAEWALGQVNHKDRGLQLENAMFECLHFW